MSSLQPGYARGHTPDACGDDVPRVSASAVSSRFKDADVQRRECLGAHKLDAASASKPSVCKPNGPFCARQRVPLHTRPGESVLYGLFLKPTLSLQMLLS